MRNIYVYIISIKFAGGDVMKIISRIITLMGISALVFAGGNNEYVKFPIDYNKSFIHYNTQNRANNKQIADMYANDIAIQSSKSGSLADGSIIVMEIYKPVLDESETPVIGEDGLFIKSDLAAVAVMEKRGDWSADFPADERAGDWGFALYTPEGKPKDNDLECATCHNPLSNQNYMFTFPKLGEN